MIKNEEHCSEVAPEQHILYANTICLQELCAQLDSMVASFPLPLAKLQT